MLTQLFLALPGFSLNSHTMADNDLYNLELLSLVAKITQEIDNHMGYNDKSLGEFVINLHENSNKNLDTFKATLTEYAPFPDSFIQNVDRLILSMHPKYKKKKKKSATTLGKRQKPDDDLTELERKKRIFPGLALRDKEVPFPVSDDVFLKELGDLVAGKTQSHPTEVEPERKRLRRSLTPPPRRRSRSPRRVDDNHGYISADTRSRRRPSPSYERSRGKQTLDERPVLYKIYDGKVSGIKEFGAFVTLEGVAGRVEGKFLLDSPTWITENYLGMVHVSNIQVGARANSAADLLNRGKIVKVKVISIAGSRIGLSMKDVDQVTGRDLTPHLAIKSDAELEEERQRGARISSGANAVPLRGRDDGPPVRTAKRLTSPERWEIKQLISSGAIDPSEYPELDEELNNPTAHIEIEEELDIEIREEEPPFLAGQTKRTLDLSPVKVVKAPDGSLNRAALAGASLAKERRELRQQEVNEQADSEARDFSQPWLDPMAKETEKVFAQDLRGHLRGQKAHEVSSWKESSLNKTTTYGEITSLSIQDQRKSLPIYKLRDPLLKAIEEVWILYP